MAMQYLTNLLKPSGKLVKFGVVRGLDCSWVALLEQINWLQLGGGRCTLVCWDAFTELLRAAVGSLVQPHVAINSCSLTSKLPNVGLVRYVLQDGQQPTYSHHSQQAIPDSMGT